MYIARLKPGETVQIGDDTTITVRRESRGNKTWVEISAPRETPIVRKDAPETHHVDGSCP